MQFSLVIPCFNEEENLPRLIDSCLALIDRSDCEVIIVNNGSTDKSSEILRRLLKPHRNLRAIYINKNIAKSYGTIRQRVSYYLFFSYG